MREELIEKNVAKLKSNRDDRLFALFLVIALLGLRRSEVLGLTWNDVDLDNGVAEDSARPAQG